MKVKTSCQITSIRRMPNSALLITYTIKRTETRGKVTGVAITRGATFAPRWLPTRINRRADVVAWLLCSLAGFESVDVQVTCSDDARDAIIDASTDLDELVGLVAAYRRDENSPVVLRIVGIPSTLCRLASMVDGMGEDLMTWGDEVGYELVRIAVDLRDAHKDCIRGRWLELGNMYRLMGVDAEDRAISENRAKKYTGRLLDFRTNARAWVNVAPKSVQVFGSNPFGRRRRYC